jgi:hypothetical protein
MMRRLVVVVALVMAMVTATAVQPRRALATDNLVYIIPAAIGGVVALVLIIAIIMTNRSDEDKEFNLAAAQAPPAEQPGGVRFGSRCPPAADVMPLLCW